MQALIKFFSGAKDFSWWASHPADAWAAFIQLSFWIACIGAVACVILYAASGHDKLMKYAIILVAVYALLKGATAAL